MPTVVVTKPTVMQNSLLLSWRCL